MAGGAEAAGGGGGGVTAGRPASGRVLGRVRGAGGKSESRGR